MITKLKLLVDLSNLTYKDFNGKYIEEYRVYITVLDKDERFQADNVGQTLSHNGTGTFVIKSMWDEKFGGILHNGLLIPTMDKLGFQYKKLYVAIDEWANYWIGFKYDSISKLIVKDNIWEVTCDCVYNGSLRYLDDGFENEKNEEWIIL